MIEHLTEILTFLWLVVAFVTWYFSHKKAKRDAKIASTVSIINNLSVTPHLLDADLSIRRSIRRAIPFHPKHIDDTLEKNLTIILDYYEFIAQLYHDDAVDRESVKHLRGGLMLETYEATEEYINYWRKELSRDDLFKHFEEVCGVFTQENGVSSTA